MNKWCNWVVDKFDFYRPRCMFEGVNHESMNPNNEVS
jgi:hypothetical protein